MTHFTAHQSIFALSHSMKELMLYELLWEKYHTCTIKDADGFERYASLEMSFDEYVEKYIGEF